MKKRICITTVIFCFILMSIYPWDMAVTKDILIIPFTNKCNIEYEYLSEFLSHSVFTLLKDVPEYSCISPARLYDFIKDRKYKKSDLDNPNIYFNAAQYFNSKIVIRGEYFEEEGYIFIRLDAIFIKDKNPFFSRNRHLKKDIHIRDSLKQIIYELVCMFTGIELEYGVLKVTADRPCIVYVDDEHMGVTPDRIQLLTGRHTVRIDYSEGEKTETIRNLVINIEKDKETPLSVRVFVTLEVETELECSLYINKQLVGTTPYKDLLLSGKEYTLKALYERADKEKYFVYEEILSTNDEQDNHIFIPVKGKIEVVNQRKYLKASINKSPLYDIPCTFKDLVPGSYTLSIILEDMLHDKTFVLQEELIEVKPQDKIKIDAGIVEYKKAPALSLIPSAAQFYNKQSKKGKILLSIFIPSLIGTITSYCIGKFVLYPKEVKYRYQGNNDKADEVYKWRRYLGYLYYSGITLTTLTWSYSTIDGWLTMKNLSNLLYAE